MILKIFKYLFLAGCVAIGSFYITYYQRTANHVASYKKVDIVNKYKNEANSINYTINIKGGVLKIKANKTSISNLNEINLSDVTAIFTKKSKKVKITANKVILYINEKKAYLKDNVNLFSDDIKLNTDKSTIDWKINSIYSNSDISGFKGKIKFSAKGFSIKENGEVLLKHAKMIKGTSKKNKK